jgi:integrase/recombinase XerD
MNLKKLIQQYLCYQQSLGWRPLPHGGCIGAFGRFLGASVDIEDVELRQVEAFLMGKGSITATWHTKFSTLRSFYRYAISRGYVNAAPLPAVTPQRPRNFTPYIYSHDELRRLLQAIGTVRCPRCSVEPNTMRTVLLLLYGAGLRLQEAINLDSSHIDWGESVMTIYNSKFLKSRIVPFGPQLGAALADYAATRTPPVGGQFFTRRSGHRINDELIQNYFSILRRHVGIIRSDVRRFQPRLHDLRHTFAVHRLTSWYQQGADVQRLLPKLSTYLGHVHIQATQVYLTMTPELLQEAGKRFEHYAVREGHHEG